MEDANPTAVLVTWRQCESRLGVRRAQRWAYRVRHHARDEPRDTERGDGRTDGCRSSELTALFCTGYDLSGIIPTESETMTALARAFGDQLATASGGQQTLFPTNEHLGGEQYCVVVVTTYVCPDLPCLHGTTTNFEA